MTAEEIVKAKWPSARALPSAENLHPAAANWAIYIGPHTFGRRRKSSWCSTEKGAWRDAASRIQRDPVEQEGK